MDGFLDALSYIPGTADLRDAIFQWWAEPWGERLFDLGRFFFQLVGLIEFVKFVDKRVFKRRSHLERKLELLEEEVKLDAGEIGGLRDQNAKLADELKSTREKLPEAAIARAEHEWRDNNKDAAVRHLDRWLGENAEGVSAIAVNLAKFHISHAIPDPGDHLDKARQMLRLARGATPDSKEAQELSAEFNRVNGELQEQLIRGESGQIAWNSAMAQRLKGQGDGLLPVVETYRNVAQYYFEKGLWRLAPLLADRAADLALSGGPALRRVWIAAERVASYYQGLAGDNSGALVRVEHVIAEAQKSLKPRDTLLLDALQCRASLLDRLGRFGQALAEIDAFAPIQAEVKGARDPDTLITRWLRATVLSHLGRYGEALAEIDAFAPIEAEVRGARHPDTLTTQYSRAGVLDSLGQYREALAAIDSFASIEAEVRGARHPNTLATRYLRAYVLRNLGRYGEALAEIGAVLPIAIEVLGARHPVTLTARYLRADVLDNLGRYQEALAAIGSFATIEVEVKGAHHPDALTTQQLRGTVLIHLGRFGDALAELEKSRPAYEGAYGAAHPFVLTARAYRAECLARTGDYEGALAEIRSVLSTSMTTLGPSHYRTLAYRSLLAGLEVAINSNVDHIAELRQLVEDLTRVTSSSGGQVLRARYRLARLMFQQGRADEARVEITATIASFDPLTSPDHEVLRSARALLEMIDGHQPSHPLIP